jgi:hypothetical protein
LKEINEQPSKLLTAVNAEEVRHAAKMVSQSKIPSSLLEVARAITPLLLQSNGWGCAAIEQKQIISSESRFMSYGFDQRLHHDCHILCTVAKAPDT